MTPRLMKIIATVAVAAALAIGAAALAGAGSGIRTASTAAGDAGGGSLPGGAGGGPPAGAAPASGIAGTTRPDPPGQRPRAAGHHAGRSPFSGRESQVSAAWLPTPSTPAGSAGS